MITDQKPLMKALRRSHGSTSSSPSTSGNSSSLLSTSSWVHLRSALLVAAHSSSTLHCSTHPDLSNLKSPWSRRRRKRALRPKQWKSLFTPEGKLVDGGVSLLKKVRIGGVDPSIRAEVWPFLLGVYDVNSSKEERNTVGAQNREEFENLRKQCQQIMRRNSKKNFKVKKSAENSNNCGNECLCCLDSPTLEMFSSARRSFTANLEIPVMEEDTDLPIYDVTPRTACSYEGFHDKIAIICDNDPTGDTELSDTDSFEEPENAQASLIEGTDNEKETCEEGAKEDSYPCVAKSDSHIHMDENFTTWHRIMCLDALRANDEWIVYSPSQASPSLMIARRSAESVGLKDFDHLEPCKILHASRLVSLLQAYSLYDPEIGYCQGMTDLLSPIISVIEDDVEAFWSFVGFMKKARHNFRLDEMGIRRQLNIVSKIIKCKDIHLYRHLEKLQAEDCFFVYRMVVVLFRRELSFEETLCLWEVVWADQAAIKAGIAKSAWRRMTLRAPPSEDLLLYAIAACVLQRRKLIIEKYSSMDEIMRECNSLAGHLDVWKLLDDAHDLVATLHDKI